MGVLNALACNQCRQWIDINKDGNASWVAEAPEAPNYYPSEEPELINEYWGGRALWFVWHHRTHDLEWLSESRDEDRFDKLRDEYAQVEKHRQPPADGEVG